MPGDCVPGDAVDVPVPQTAIKNQQQRSGAGAGAGVGLGGDNYEGSSFKVRRGVELQNRCLAIFYEG